MSRKRIFVFILGLLSIVFVLTYTKVIHPYEIQAMWAYITQRPPIEWRGIIIDYKYGMNSVEYNDSISIQYIGKGNEESLGVHLEGEQSIEQLKTRNYNGTVFTFITDKFDRSYGHEIYVVTIRKNDNNRYMVFYHVLDLKIAIGYAGTEEGFPAYIELIDKILFLNKKK